jgi:probable FeS assembly SUF system protein SufT
MVPSGEKVTLDAGSTVWLTQALAGSFTVMTDRGYTALIDAAHAEALGFAPAVNPPVQGVAAATAEAMEAQVWDRLRSCFDPEIPVNIVDLGLIYDCAVAPLPTGGYRATVRFTLTAQGCGMGEFLKADIRNKLLALPGMREADVELVWDPPWSQSRISGPAKQQLGIE